MTLPSHPWRLDNQMIRPRVSLDNERIRKIGSVSTEPICIPELVFRENWKTTPAARPLTQAQVAHPGLVLALHGTGARQLKKSHHDEIDGDPYYIWSGKCDGAWAISLRHRNALIDLSRGGLVRWNAKQSGSRRLRLILKPEDRPWVVSDQFHGASAGWHEYEIEIAKATWRELEIETVTPGESLAGASLGLEHIDAIGVTDLMPGDGSGNCSRLDWIEVWGRSVTRASP